MRSAARPPRVIAGLRALARRASAPRSNAGAPPARRPCRGTRTGRSRAEWLFADRDNVQPGRVDRTARTERAPRKWICLSGTAIRATTTPRGVQIAMSAALSTGPTEATGGADHAGRRGSAIRSPGVEAPPAAIRTTAPAAGRADLGAAGSAATLSRSRPEQAGPRATTGSGRRFRRGSVPSTSLPLVTLDGHTGLRRALDREHASGAHQEGGTSWRSGRAGSPSFATAAPLTERDRRDDDEDPNDLHPWVVSPRGVISVIVSRRASLRRARPL